MGGNLYEILRERFAGALDSVCLELADGHCWTYGDLDRLSDQLAQVMLRSATAGDRVLVQVDKCPEAVALYLACLRSALVLIPLNTAYTAAELAYFVADAQPVLEVDNETLRQLCEQARDIPPSKSIAQCDDNSLAAIVYTSGTTGRSKGAMLTHHNLSSNALTLHALWGFEPGDVLLHALPIFHVHGLFIALNTAILNASRILFLEKFETAAVLAALPRATVMMGVPTFYTRLLASEDFDAKHYAHMRLFICGSAPLTEATFDEFEQRTGHRILERYGMSEAGMITSNPLHGERVAGTVGFALPGVNIRVADEQGQPLPTGEVGIVEARGPNIFCGYWNMPEKTAAEFRGDGYFITGDMGIIDAQGRLSIVGREKDLIISGGYNIYPKEVELCLDGIEGIAESAVFGVPHPDFGEAVVAACVASEGELPSMNEIQEALRDKLARFKQPKHIIKLDELPRNTMGKVQKNLLRQDYQTLFE